MSRRTAVFAFLIACIPGSHSRVQAELPDFAHKAGYFVGTSPFSVIAADLDSDGDLDIAVSLMYWGRNIAVLKNDGLGGFLGPVYYFSDGQSAPCIGAGDLDGDHDLDLVTVDFTDISLSTLLNNGGGTFPQPAVVYPFPNFGYSSFDLACDDFTGDGKADVVQAVRSGSIPGGVRYIGNTGNGTLTLWGEYSGSADPWTISTADIDGDSDLDFITANSGNSVSVFENSGDGFITSISTYPAGSVSGDVLGGDALGADLDGDGDVDLATANRPDHAITVLLNDSGAGFLPPVHHAIGLPPLCIASADLDLDGDVDLVTGDGGDSDSISFHENNGDGTFQSPVRIPVGGTVVALECAALGPDLDIDIVATALNPDSVYVLENLICSVRRGDANESGQITAADIVFLVNSVFKSGLSPACNGASGDVNCSGSITSSDIIYLVDFVFKSGLAPC